LASLLRIDKICKSFPGVKALDDICIEIDKGEVHAIVGENGAGKTTLMRILAGILVKDSGDIYFEGKPVSFSNTREARELGISIIHQELNLPVNLGIHKNIFLGRFPKNKLGLIKNKILLEETKKQLKVVGLEEKPQTIIETLTVAAQQLVEIAKALSFNSKLLIMDEPTSALNQQETQNLFSIIQNLKKNGVTIIYISHRLEEVFTVADKITVMRDGKISGTKLTNEATHEMIVKMMTGKSLDNFYSKNRVVEQDNKSVVLEVSNITSKARNLGVVDFKLYKGEILGIAGLLGSGRTELMKAIFGAHKKSSGKIVLNGQEITIKTPVDAVKHGIALMPEDRKTEGLVLEMDIKNNISLTSMKRLSKANYVLRNKQNELAERMSETLKIKSTGIHQIVQDLSGGNQQKVVFAKWLAAKPRVLLLDDPTRGIDVGAKSEIYSLIRELANQGIGIIFISSEMPELVGASDRVLVMRNGEIVKEINGEEITEDNLMLIATGKDI